MSLQALLGLDIPIIQAPMAGVQNWELAAAVSQAGALGSIPCGMLSAEQIKSEIESFKANSNKPYNLNFFCHEMPLPDQSKLTAWEEVLSPYYSEFNLAIDSNITGLRRPFDSEIADAIEPYSAKIISFHFGLPAPELLTRVKSWGATVLSSATTVEEGIWLEKNGADVVIAQGSEAGGHRGMFLSDDLSRQLDTLSLTTQLVQQLSIPVVAAGGIASNKDIKVMLELGVAGVQIGTSYLLCPEAKTSSIHRDALKDEQSLTAITNIFSGRPARGIRNRLMNELGELSELAPDFPYASVALAPLRKAAELQLSADFTSLWSGTNRTGCKEIPAARLTKELWGQR